MNKKVDVIVDLQFGSTGKGLIAGYLAKALNYDMVVNANMPNAGHTFIDATGRTWIHKVLPNGIVAKNVNTVGLGPGSVFKVEQLKKELNASADLMQNKRFFIHEAAVVLTEEHAKTEQQNLSKISSTMQGSAAAMVHKIMRNPESSPLARDTLEGTGLEHYVVTHYEWMSALYEAKKILLEGAQGYSLGINSGFWPYCTSRDCTPGRFMSDCAIPADWLHEVIGTARLHPIRVGNTPDGYSGDCYPDQKELSWEDLGQTPEKTTVTQRVRRVFTFSEEQMDEAIMQCRPNRVFLNFCNYDEEYTPIVVAKIREILRRHSVDGKVAYLGWGPTELDVRLGTEIRK